MVEQRTRTGIGYLARLGFADASTASRQLGQLVAEHGVDPDVLLNDLGGCADPDMALRMVAALIAACEDVAELVLALNEQAGFRRRLVRVLGASEGLAEHLIRQPQQWVDLATDEGDQPATAAEFRAELLRAVAADPDAAAPVATCEGPAGTDQLRIAYRRRLLGLAARDLTHDDPTTEVDGVAAELADLASAVLEAALALARATLSRSAVPCRLAIIGMGKCGGRELNYVSDVDVVFVAEPVETVPTDGASAFGNRTHGDAGDGDAGDGDAGHGGRVEACSESGALETAARLASQVMTTCSAHTGAGTIWPVDAGLRPEGKAGPLVRTLASHVAYARRWAKTWEFQAMLKARPIAGDHELGRAYVEAMADLVWHAADGPGFVDDVQAMRRRVVDHIPTGQVDRQLKLGPGGLRDVEFAVQLLQLVHGRGDETLRSPTTLHALEALTDAGYVGRDDGANLAAAYRFLRTLEHRLQLYRLRRTHVVPDDERELRRLGRSLGLMTEPVAELTAEWKRHAREARRLHEKLFYRPLLGAVARIPRDETTLAPQAARARLTALGYADPAAALRHIEALIAGVSRRAAIQRTLLPAMLGWFADAADPDTGLLAFRQVSDVLGATHWYLRLLRDEGATAENMARLLASSRYASDLLLRAPEGVAMLASDQELRPRARAPLEAEMRTAAGRYDRPDSATTAIRAVRRRELFRIASGDVLGRLTVDQVGDALSDATTATIAGSLAVAVRAVEATWGRELPTRLAVVGMGRLGGHEMSYASDADVMFVHDPVESADEAAAAEAASAVVAELRRMLAAEGTDPPLGLDISLRPEGRSGPMVRTLASYRAYYARWSRVWETQALLRAEPFCGDAELREQFRALIDPLRWPEHGLDSGAVSEIRRIKARVDAERLPRGADPHTHTKVGRGGLADIEWTVQLLQLRYAHEVPGLRTTRTLAALEAAADADVVRQADAATLADAWKFVTRARNATTLARARPSDSLPHEPRDRAAVARLLGYGPDDVGTFLDDYLKLTRRARSVVEQVFWA